GAIGCGISGSGPSVFAFSSDKNRADKIADAMQNAFREAGLDSDRIISSLSSPGAKIIDEVNL
ncbi:MAG TPA: homoserine kinase, partial [Bacteroidales bacterium]|nr:homoserine kinase [Bacteroidales bacterium]